MTILSCIFFWHRRHTDCSTNERRGVPNVTQTFLLDEVCHCWREILVVGLYVVLQNQTAERTCWLICGKKIYRVTIKWLQLGRGNMWGNGNQASAEKGEKKEGGKNWQSRTQLKTEGGGWYQIITYPQISVVSRQRWDSCWSLETGSAALVSEDMVKEMGQAQ